MALKLGITKYKKKVKNLNKTKNSNIKLVKKGNNRYYKKKDNQYIIYNNSSTKLGISIMIFKIFFN